jgi:hypothetical protein
MTKNDDSVIVTFFAWCGLILGIIILFSAILGPYYAVWQQGLEGKSELMKAQKH